jgi:hypothetical protein
MDTAPNVKEEWPQRARVPGTVSDKTGINASTIQRLRISAASGMRIQK